MNCVDDETKIGLMKDVACINEYDERENHTWFYSKSEDFQFQLNEEQVSFEFCTCNLIRWSYPNQLIRCSLFTQKKFRFLFFHLK